MIKRILFTLFIAAFALSACGGNATPDPALDPVLAMTQAFATVNAAFTQTAFAIPTNTPAPTETPTPTMPPQPTQFTPTVTLTVSVTVPANCRFGPSTTYAGPGGFRTGKVLEAIGRDASGQWLLVREAGGKKSCWVNIIALSVQGDIATLAIAPVQLLINPDYPPPSNITATRNGDQVRIAWSEVPLQPQVTYIDSHYFLELWVCNGGQLTYTILATQDLTVTVTDQPGCAEASHGLLYTTTREGYSAPAVIPWP
jgi:hypothetical protein